MRRYDFAYIPTGHKLHLDELKDHEFFGGDLVSGESTVAIFENQNGTRYAIWSYGDWDHYNVDQNYWYNFSHTQTNRRVSLRYLRTITAKDLFIHDSLPHDGKVIQWTLK